MQCYSDSFPLNLLFVDDEVGVHELTNLYFKKDLKTGLVKTHHFTDGHDCLSFLDYNNDINLHLVLLDINMPGINGFELLKELKKRRPDVEVIMVSAYDSEKYINKSKELGASKFIAKPVDLDELKSKIYKKFNVPLK